MKKIRKLLLTTVLVGVFFGSEASAQQSPMRKGEEEWGPCKYYTRHYNRHLVESVAGEVVSVDEFRPVEDVSPGVQIMLKTDKETIPVHLGPSWYVDNQDVRILPGNKVEVKGSRINFQDKTVIMAAEVKRGNQNLVLRQMDGFPIWASEIDWSSYHWGE